MARIKIGSNPRELLETEKYPVDEKATLDCEEIETLKTKPKEDTKKKRDKLKKRARIHQNTGLVAGALAVVLVASTISGGVGSVFPGLGECLYCRLPGCEYWPYILEVLGVDDPSIFEESEELWMYGQELHWDLEYGGLPDDNPNNGGNNSGNNNGGNNNDDNNGSYGDDDDSNTGTNVSTKDGLIPISWPGDWLLAYGNRVAQIGGRDLMDYLGSIVADVQYYPPTQSGFNENGYYLKEDYSEKEGNTLMLVDDQGRVLCTQVYQIEPENESLSSYCLGDDNIFYTIVYDPDDNYTVTYYNENGSILYQADLGHCYDVWAGTFHDGVAYYSYYPADGSGMHQLYGVDLNGNATYLMEHAGSILGEASQGYLLTFTSRDNAYQYTLIRPETGEESAEVVLMPAIYMQNKSETLDDPDAMYIFSDSCFETYKVGTKEYYIYGTYAVIQPYGTTMDALVDLRDVTDGVLNAPIAVFDTILFNDYQYLAVEDYGQWFYIDYKCSQVGEIYDDATSFNEKGYAMVLQDGVASVINSDFEIVYSIPDMRFTDIQDHGEMVALLEGDPTTGNWYLHYPDGDNTSSEENQMTTGLVNISVLAGPMRPSNGGFGAVDPSVGPVLLDYNGNILAYLNSEMASGPSANGTYVVVEYTKEENDTFIVYGADGYRILEWEGVGRVEIGDDGRFYARGSEVITYYDADGTIIYEYGEEGNYSEDYYRPVRASVFRDGVAYFILYSYGNNESQCYRLDTYGNAELIAQVTGEMMDFPWDGYAAVYTEDGYYLVDVATGETGTSIKSYNFQTYYVEAHEQMHFGRYGVVQWGGQYALIDFFTVEVVDGNLENVIGWYDKVVADDYEHLAAWDSDGWYYIDLSGNRVSDTYEYASAFNDLGYAMVVIDGTAHVINQEFEIIETISDMEIRVVEEYGDCFRITTGDGIVYQYYYYK